jgi:hypothetical protein
VGVGGGGSAGHHHASSSFSSSMSGMLHSPGGRQSSASGAPTGAVEGSVENRGTAGLLVGQQQVKRRVSNHRRFASMGANVGALQ